MSRRPKRSLMIPLTVAALVMGAGTAHAVQHVVLNGERMRVNWNDGDSFKVLRGSKKGTSARLMGYNTLESYGPVHFWGGFTGRDLYDIATKGTKLARATEWDCQTEGEEDRYGRILVNCPELTGSIVKAGYAHVFTVLSKADRDLDLEVLRSQVDTGRRLVSSGKVEAGLDKLEEASESAGKLGKRKGYWEHVRLQREAQNERRGLWKWGIPARIVTSIHSTDEQGRGDQAYNRVCDTRTGHSWKVAHALAFKTCDAWCHGGSCMVYVPFKERYGKQRPDCLRGGHRNRVAPPAHLQPSH